LTLVPHSPKPTGNACYAGCTPSKKKKNGKKYPKQAVLLSHKIKPFQEPLKDGNKKDPRVFSYVIVFITNKTTEGSRFLQKLDP